MSQRIYRSFQEPKREGLSWDEQWKGNDTDLITCWEVGREMRSKKPELAKRAEEGELPTMLGWKGDADKKMKKNKRYGTLYYLAQWQGLRGEDLDIGLSEERELICSKTGMKVIYTGNIKKYGNQSTLPQVSSAPVIRCEGNPGGALYGESLVFTGTLEIKRQEAANLAVAIGSQVTPGVTKKTTMLTVEDQDIRKLAGHEKSSKHRKVEELIAKGEMNDDWTTDLSWNTQTANKDTGHYMTLEQISIELGVTRERVRQIEQAALRKARRILDKHGFKLEDLLPGLTQELGC